MFQKARDILLAKTGIQIEFTPAKTIDEIIKKLKSGEADFAALESPDYVRAVEGGVKAVPVVHLAINGKETANVCLYQLKNSKGTQDIAALKGKRVSMTGMWDWIYLQNYLKENKIDKRVKDYFSAISISKNMESSLYELIFGKTDVIVATDSSFTMASRADKRFKDIVRSECMGEYPNGPTVVNPGVDKKDVQKLLKVFMGAHKDKDFKDFKIYFVAANARFIPVNADFYKPFFERVQAARKAGWISDFEKFSRQQAQK